ncbi:hypothetical protein [Burkholderia diffusa]|uniref:hypothetical protein n=1 Tax=Burkholderia diffusa TaxID=488732 RepID=UPI000A90B683|nr:hypothetical protein [Burkholderia diffusa]
MKRQGALGCLVVFSLLVLAACGGENNPPPSTESGPSNTINSPVTVSAYPAAAGQGNSVVARFYIPAKKIGTQSVDLPLLLDTGSAGVTLNALEFFPSSMVNSSGFIFPPGKTSMTYNGITVTDQNASKSFGNSNSGTTQIGNLGFASVTFGAQGEVTTEQMPVLLYYSIVNTRTQQPIIPPPQQGIFGINSGANPLVVQGGPSAPTSLSVCDAQSSSTCDLVSPLRYLNYGKGIDAGFLLRASALQSCDITVHGSCTGQPLLTVGLTNDLTAGFASMPLTCAGLSFSGSFNGTPVCGARLPGGSVTANGNSISANLLFDTGTYAYNLALANPSPGFSSSAIPVGTNVTVTTGSGFNYTFTRGADGGPSAFDIIQPAAGTSSTAPSVMVVGIDFFAKHSFFIDFSNSMLGWQ